MRARLDEQRARVDQRCVALVRASNRDAMAAACEAPKAPAASTHPTTPPTAQFNVQPPNRTSPPPTSPPPVRRRRAELQQHMAAEGRAAGLRLDQLIEDALAPRADPATAVPPAAVPPSVAPLVEAVPLAAAVPPAAIPSAGAVGGGGGAADGGSLGAAAAPPVLPRPMRSLSPGRAAPPAAPALAMPPAWMRREGMNEMLAHYDEAMGAVGELPELPPLPDRRWARPAEDARLRPYRRLVVRAAAPVGGAVRVERHGTGYRIVPT